MTDLITILQGLAALIGIGIAAGSYLLSRRTSTDGWTSLAIAGAFIAYWAIGSFVATQGSGISISVNIIGISGFSLFFSTAAVKIASEELPADTPDWFSVRNVKIYIIAVFIPIIVIGSLSGLTPELHSLLFYQNFGLLIPSLYGFYRLYRQNKRPAWLALTATSAIGMTTILGTKYAASFCSTHHDPVEACQGFETYFATQLNFPLIEPVLQLATIPALWTFLTVTSFGIGTFLFAQQMQRSRTISHDDRPIEQLIRGGTDAIGDIIGYQLANRITHDTLQDNVKGLNIALDDKELTIEIDEDEIDDNTFTTVREELINAFDDHVGPVARRKIIEIAEQLQNPD